MRKVQIYYNPYLKHTRLVVDGIEHCGSAKRIDDYIIGKPISTWLTDYSESYYRWNGILPELMEELNDDELEILFYGFREDYLQVEQAMMSQISAVEELGFASAHWSLNHRDAYSTQDLKNALSAFITRFKLEVPDQQSLLIFEEAERKIRKMEAPTVEGLLEISNMLHKALAAVIAYYQGQQFRNYSSRINYWKDAEKRLSHVLEGGAQ